MADKVDKAKVIVPDDVKAAVDAIHPAHQPGSATNAYLVLAYTEPTSTTLKIVGQGDGFVDEAVALMADGEVSYALLRTGESLDQAKTAKYAFLDFTPGNLKPMRKAQVTTHKGQVKTLFKANADITFGDKAEINLDVVRKALGLISSVTDRAAAAKSAAAAPAAAPAPAADEKKVAPKPAPAPPNMKKSAPAGDNRKFVSAAGQSAIEIDQKEQFDGIMKELRKDKSDTDWVLLSFNGQKLSLLGSGNGGVEALAQKLEPALVNFGLVRVTELVDNKSNTTKFVHIRSVPGTITPLKKAGITAKKGSLDAIFQPFHVELTVEKPDELSHQIIMDKVGTASGTKSHVVSRD